jgi:hypothetical protein
MPSDQEKVQTIDSWKAIADYLGVSIRTAQSWEKERRLPIHRDGSGPRARVFAVREDLDRWKGSSIGTSAESSAGNTARRLRFAALLVAVSVLTAASYLAIRVSVGESRVANPAACRQQSNYIEVFDAAGEMLWMEQLLPYPREQNADSLGCLVADIDRDGRNEVLVATHDPPHWISGRLHCFDPDGRKRWVGSFEETLRFGERTFTGFYVKWFTPILDTDPPYVAVSLANVYFPSATLLLDPNDGREVSRYLHPGHIEHFARLDLDGDGAEELLLGGVNNPGEGLGLAALVALELPFPDPDPAVIDLFGRPGGQETAYLLFPRSDGDADVPYQQGIGPMTRVGPDHILVLLALGPSWAFKLNRDLEVVEARPSDYLISYHKHLEAIEILNHSLTPLEIEAMRQAVRSFPTAPNANSPEIQRLFPAFGEPGNDPES